MSSPLISLAGVGKDYPMVAAGAGRVRTLLSLLAGVGGVRHLSALREVDLEVKQGESLGLVGENGAGKSTLLKVIAGVVKPTRGKVVVSGRVGALLELGSGFHPEYTGRENIALSAALAGFSRAEIEGRVQQIIAFADIGEHIDQPVKHYSSGMVVRLGFAIATALAPDVLITDEVLAVGDESFQRKCIGWMERFLGNGGTLLLCSHGMYHVQTLCQKAAWLHDGRIRAYGDSFSVTQDYLAYHEEKRRAEPKPAAGEGAGGGHYAVRSIAIHDSKGRTAEEFATGETVDIRLEIRSLDDRPPVALIGVVRVDGTPVYGTHSDEHDFSPMRVGPQEYVFGFRLLKCALIPGKYRLRAHALDPEGLRLYDTVEADFTVRGATRDYGLVSLAHEWYDPAK